MARLQWCRKHIDEVAEACNLSNSAKMEVKQAGRFCDENSEFSELPTKPIIALMRVRDVPVRERAILKCKERLNGKIGAGRGNTKELTETQVKKIIEVAQSEILQELGDKQPKVQPPKTTSPPVDTTSSTPTTPPSSTPPTTTPPATTTPPEAQPRATPAEINKKIRKIRDVLKPKHLQYLHKIMDVGNALNELEALYFVMDIVCG